MVIEGGYRRGSNVPGTLLMKVIKLCSRLLYPVDAVHRSREQQANGFSLRCRIIVVEDGSFPSLRADSRRRF